MYLAISTIAGAMIIILCFISIEHLLNIIFIKNEWILGITTKFNLIVCFFSLIFYSSSIVPFLYAMI